MTEATIAFIDQGREAHGVGSIGTPWTIAPSTYKSTTLTCVEWFSMRRVPERLGDVRPAEYKARDYEQAPAA